MDIPINQQFRVLRVYGPGRERDRMIDSEHEDFNSAMTAAEIAADRYRAGVNNVIAIDLEQLDHEGLGYEILESISVR